MNQSAACYPFFAPLISETEKALTYGPGLVLGEFMNVNYKPTYAEAQVYGDNRLVIDAREPNGGDITLGVTWLPFAAESVVFGRKAISGNEHSTTVNDSRKYGLFGYIKKCNRGNTVKYVVKVVYKTSFTAPDDTATTKGGNLQINTPSINGKAYMPKNGEQDHEWEYDSLEEAINKANLVGNIGVATAFVAQPAIYPDNSAPVLETTGIMLACDTPGAIIHYTTNGDEPDSNATVYTAPFTLDASCTVKAIAYKGGNISDISEKAYVI